jgi:drug/metabolite transporter, DME family
LPVAVAIVLQYTAPALVVAATSLPARRLPSRPVAASLVAALAGVVLITGAMGDLGALDPVGVTLGLASAALFASYTLLGQRARRDLPALPLMLRVFAVAAVFWSLFPDARPEMELLDRTRLLGVLFVGIGGTLVPFLLYVWAVAHVRAERAAIAATLEPVVAALAAWTWLGQRLTVTQIVGGALVILAVLGLARRPDAEEVPPPA